MEHYFETHHAAILAAHHYGCLVSVFARYHFQNVTGLSSKLLLISLTTYRGIVATLQGVVSNQAGFYAVRFFLGFVEGGLFPGVVFYFSMVSSPHVILL